MKTIDLQKEKLELSQIFDSARIEPVLLLTGDGQEFILSPADEFEGEAQSRHGGTDGLFTKPSTQRCR